MKRSLLLLLITAFSLSGHAQFKAFEIKDACELLIVPSYMTKDGKNFLYSYGDDGIIIYDDNFNIIKQYNPSYEINYKSREVKFTRLIDPDTKEFLSEWTVEYDRTQDYTESNVLWLIYIVSEENSLGNPSILLSQTLFDEDEEFEFIRRRLEVIPITTKAEDYINDHSKGGLSGKEAQYSSDEWWREYGAETYETTWDNEKQKTIYVLVKYEKYGGIYRSGLEVVNLDGIVEQTFSGLNNSYYAYHVNGYFILHGLGEKVAYRINSHKLPETNVNSYDLNRDGKVNVADHVELSKIIMGK